MSARDEDGNPITQQRWEKVLCQLEEACAASRADRQYAIQLQRYVLDIQTAAMLLIGVLTHPNADHTHYMDEVRMLQAALAKNPAPAAVGLPPSGACEEVVGVGPNDADLTMKTPQEGA